MNAVTSMRRAPGGSDLLGLVGEVMGVLDLDQLRPALVAALRRAVPAKWAALNEVGPRRIFSLVQPHLDEEWYAKFAELAEENPLYRRWVRTRDGRAFRFSDENIREELERTRLWREFYEPLGINHQMAFTLPSPGDHVVALVLVRGEDDFSDAERDFVNRARPFLIQAYRNAVAYTAAAQGSPERLETQLVEHGLTAREAQVMRLTALGRSPRDVAAALGVSHRTVQKHLERAFRKLGVTSRSDAAARAWELAA